MSALFTALVESETKESLAVMVIDLRKEVAELRAKTAAYKMLDAAQCAQISYYAKETRVDDVARKTLDSEREANALLTAENERLRKEVDELRANLDNAHKVFGAGCDEIEAIVAYLQSELIDYKDTVNRLTEEKRTLLREVAELRDRVAWAMSGERLYQHPLNFKPLPISSVLAQVAGQENCDGADYDLMQAAAEYIRDLRAENERLRKEAAELRAALIAEQKELK